MRQLSPDILLTSQATPPVLLGILIDVSHSMQDRWKNQDGKQVPRIEVIRDVLNQRIREEQQQSQTQKDKLENIDVFCLGFGFRYRYYLTDDINVAEQDQPLTNLQKDQEFIDLICDLLALCEILPTREKLADFKDRLDQKWRQCTREIFDQADISEDVYDQLVDYVETKMLLTALQRHEQGLFYRLSRRFRWNLFVELAQREDERIRTVAKREADHFLAGISREATEDFEKNQEKYITLITRRLEKFVKDYAALTLQALPLGFSATEIVDHLDEEQVLSLAGKIYEDLEKEVRAHIQAVLSHYLRRLWSARNSISAQLKMKQVIYFTEQFIRKQGWGYLRPLIEDTVYDMLTHQFESRAQENFSHWLRLAASREVVRPLTKLSSLLPAIFEEQVYSEQIMFGTSPFRKTLDLAAMRFVDEAYKNHKKVLFIISDGNFRDESEVMVTADLLKKRGVTIVSCLIHQQNLLAQIPILPSKELPVGARRMIEIASEVPLPGNLQSNTHKRSLATALMENKLCYQVNHSRLLDELVANLFEERAATDNQDFPKPKRRSKKKAVG